MTVIRANQRETYALSRAIAAKDFVTARHREISFNQE